MQAGVQASCLDEEIHKMPLTAEADTEPAETTNDEQTSGDIGRYPGLDLWGQCGHVAGNRFPGYQLDQQL